MKKSFILIVFILLHINGMAQQKLFDEAIAKGQQSNGFYRIENKKRKELSLDALKSYCRQHGYIVGAHPFVDYQRFGSYISVLDYFDFMVQDEYPKYVFKCLNGSSQEYGNLKSKGTVILQDTEVIVQHRGLITEKQEIKVFKVYNQVLWSGDLINGLVDGTGVGFLPSSKFEGLYMLFEGTFKSGLPSSDIIVKRINIEDTNNLSVSYRDIQTSKFEALPTEKLIEYTNTDNPTVKSAILGRLKYNKDYLANVQLVNQCHNQALNQYGKVKENETNWLNLKTIYETANYDPQGILPKICELIDINNVKNALNDREIKDYFIIKKQFLWAIWDEWNSEYEQQKGGQITKAVESANRGKTERNYKYKDFFTKASTELENMNNEYRSKLSAAVKRWNAIIDERNRREARANAEFQRKQEHDSRYIGQIKPPSGKLYQSLLGVYLHHDENGKIRDKNGQLICTYNIYYSQNGRKVEYYKLSLSAPHLNLKLQRYEFKNEEEMLSELIRALGAQ